MYCKKYVLLNNMNDYNFTIIFRKYHYEDFVSFVRSGQSCGFLPSNLQHIIPQRKI